MIDFGIKKTNRARTKATTAIIASRLPCDFKTNLEKRNAINPMVKIRLIISSFFIIIR